MYTYILDSAYIHTYIDIQTYSGNNGAGVQVVFHAMPARQDKTRHTRAKVVSISFLSNGMAWHAMAGGPDIDQRPMISVYFSYLPTLIIYSPILLVPYIHTMYVCIGGQRISPVFGNGHESLVDVLQPESDSDNRPCVRGGPTLHGERLGYVKLGWLFQDDSK